MMRARECCVGVWCCLGQLCRQVSCAEPAGPGEGGRGQTVLYSVAFDCITQHTLNRI